MKFLLSSSSSISHLEVFWSKSSHHWLSEVFLTGTPVGGSQTHSPVVRLANMCSCVLKLKVYKCIDNSLNMYDIS